MRGVPTIAVLNVLAGIVVLVIAVLMDQLVSIGGILGLLLILNGLVRLELARRA